MIVLALPAFAADEPEPAPERFRVFSLPIRATALIGKEARNADGERVGRLRELVFDLHNNRVRGEGTLVDVVIDAFWGDVPFAAVALDGEGDAEDVLRPVPLDALRVQGKDLALEVKRIAVAILPGFTLQELDAQIADRAFLHRNARYAHQLTPLQ